MNKEIFRERYKTKLEILAGYLKKIRWVFRGIFVRGRMNFLFFRVFVVILCVWI